MKTENKKEKQKRKKRNDEGAFIVVSDRRTESQGRKETKEDVA